VVKKKKPQKLQFFMLSFGLLKKLNSQGAKTHHKKEIPHANY